MRARPGVRGLRRAVVSPGPAGVTHGAPAQWRGMAARFPCQGTIHRARPAAGPGRGCSVGGGNGFVRQGPRDVPDDGHVSPAAFGVAGARKARRRVTAGATNGASILACGRKMVRTTDAGTTHHPTQEEIAPPRGLRRGASASARARLGRFMAGRGSRGDVRQQLTSHHTAASGARRTATGDTRRQLPTNRPSAVRHRPRVSCATSPTIRPPPWPPRRTTPCGCHRWHTRPGATG
ncbi:hypothetical protein HRbin28_00143 [bacterium HR28]|nr:hypothetical protein HRbin28_00143 [bacterium HR28]